MASGALSNTNIYSSAAYIDSDLIDEDDEQPVPAPPKPPKTLGLELKYNTHRNRKTKHPYHLKEQLKVTAEVPVKLIPIRLDIDVEGIKLRDVFTWNLNEALMSPEQFAQILADDIDSPYANQFVPLIAQAIRQQCASYAAAAEEDGNKEVSRAPKSDDDEYYNDLRIIVKLDLHVGNLNLKDRFEWPLFSETLSPEDFAKHLCSDLGIGGEFIAHIAHSIREQVYLARLNFDEADPAPDFRTRPFRPEHAEEDWEPELRELSEQEIERIMKEKERSTRRLRRSQKQAVSVSRTPSIMSSTNYIPTSTVYRTQSNYPTSNNYGGAGGGFQSWRTSYPTQQSVAPKSAMYPNQTVDGIQVYANMFQFQMAPQITSVGGLPPQYAPIAPMAGGAIPTSMTGSGYPGGFTGPTTFGSFATMPVPSLSFQHSAPTHISPAMLHTDMTISMMMPPTAASAADPLTIGPSQAAVQLANAHAAAAAAAAAQSAITKIPPSKKREREPQVVDRDLIHRQVELMKDPTRGGSLSPTKQTEIAASNTVTAAASTCASAGTCGPAPPKKHRGFGASANVFNADGSIDVGGTFEADRKEE
ncbi:Snf5- protein 1 [Quaeritorhiza haematococci]|nr:Snf5- protein 1 [Quaeritorhiza haematococci]